MIFSLFKLARIEIVFNKTYNKSNVNLYFLLINIAKHAIILGIVKKTINNSLF